MSARTNPPSGVIDHLIRLPADDSDARLRRGLAVSIGANVAIILFSFVASNLHDNEKPFVPFARPLNMTFDELKTIVRIPPPPPLKKPEPPKREVRRRPDPVKRVARRTPPKPVERPKPVEKPIQVAKAEPKPRVAPRNVAERPVTPTQPVAPTPQPNPTTSSAPVNRTTNNATEAARVNANRSVATTNPAAPEVSAANPNLNQPVPIRRNTNLAGGGTPTVSSNMERGPSVPSATPAASAPVTTNARTASAGRVTSASAVAAGVRGGTTSFGNASAGLGSNVASISAPTFVGRRAPALGSTVLVADRSAVMTSAMSDDGTANSGLATIQGARGTVASSVAVGRSGVQGSGAGVASINAGGRGIGTSVDARGLSVGASNTTGANRGPVTGSTIVAELGRGSVGAAAGGEGRGDGVAAVGTDVAGAAAGSARGAGGAGGVARGTGGPTRAGGAGAGAVGASAGSTGDIKVDAQTKTGADDVKRPAGNDSPDLARSNNAGGKAGTRNEDAQAKSQPEPELSSDQKRRKFKGRILVQVTVDADGSHTESLIQGSGDNDIDNAVLRALRRWKWEPAYRDGEKVRSTKKFEYTIKVND